MNQKLTSLNQLLKLKQQMTQKAYAEFMKVHEQFEQNKKKHEQLSGYRQEYLQQLDVLGEQGNYVGYLRNRINFVTHLDTALIQLNTHLAQLAKVRTKTKVYYDEAKVVEEGIAKLIARVEKEEQLKWQRMEQKEIDEYAQKQWYIKNNDKQVNSFGE